MPSTLIHPNPCHCCLTRCICVKGLELVELLDQFRYMVIGQSRCDDRAWADEAFALQLARHSEVVWALKLNTGIQRSQELLDSKVRCTEALGSKLLLLCVEQRQFCALGRHCPRACSDRLKRGGEQPRHLSGQEGTPSRPG